MPVLLQFVELAFLAYQQQWFYPALCWSLSSFTGYVFMRFKKAQERKIMALVNTVRQVPIVDHGYVRAVSSHRLVPGDVIVLQRGKALSDMVLLRGTCLVVEATLSGEVHRTCQAKHCISLHNNLPAQSLYCLGYDLHNSTMYRCCI